jgi:hypothetical protein
MLIKNAWIGLLFLVVFLPSTLVAQEMMPGKWWHDESIIDKLDLTGREKQELDRKYIDSRRKMIDLKSEIEKHRFELDLLLDTKDMDKEKIIKRYDSLEQVRKELSKERFEMLMEVRETIGADRFQELKSMHRNRHRKDVKKSHKDKKDRYYNKDRNRD